MKGFIMNTKTKKFKKTAGIILLAIVLISSLLCMFNKFPIVIIGDKLHTVFETKLEIRTVYDDATYDNDDVYSLSRMRYLKKLHLSGTDITDFSFLENMSSLKEFNYLGRIDVKNHKWEYLKECKNLESFCGEAMSISDLTVFSELTKLEKLYVDNEFGLRLDMSDVEIVINDFSGIETLTNLKEFHVCGRNINDISPLKNCKKIEKLGLYGTTAEADYSVLLELPELYSLCVDKGIIPDEIKEKLIAKGVEVYEYDY